MQELDDSLIRYLTAEEKAQALLKYQSRAEEVRRIGSSREKLTKEHGNKIKALVLSYGTSIGFNPIWEPWLNKTAFFDGTSLDLNTPKLYELAGEEASEIEDWLGRVMTVLRRKYDLINKLADIPISEQVQLIEWQKQIYSLILNEYEFQQQKQLITERDSVKDLASYKAGIEATIFGELPYAISMRGQDNRKILWFDSFRVWNLATIIERYDEGREYCTSQASLRQYAEQELLNLKQDKDSFLQKYD